MFGRVSYISPALESVKMQVQGGHLDTRTVNALGGYSSSPDLHCHDVACWFGARSDSALPMTALVS